MTNSNSNERIPLPLFTDVEHKNQTTEDRRHMKEERRPTSTTSTLNPQPSSDTIPPATYHLPPTRKRTPLWCIILVALCTLLTASGQYFLKKGAEHISDLSTVISAPFIIGCLLYGLGAILLIIALKYGELSVLYPVISLGFIWVTLISVFILHEHFTIINGAGIASVMIGVALIGKGGNS